MEATEGQETRKNFWTFVFFISVLRLLTTISGENENSTDKVDVNKKAGIFDKFYPK